MKKIVLTITLCVLALNAFAQNNGTYTKSINMELLGSSGMVGVNYDARFKGNHGDIVPASDMAMPTATMTSWRLPEEMGFHMKSVSRWK